MSTVRFIVSYIVLFIICMLPMALLGQPVLALLLLLMMHARLSVTMGWPAYLLGGALSFLSVAYLTKSPMCGLWFTVALIVPIWVGFLFTASPVKFRFSESMCGTAAAFLIPFSLWEMSFIRLSGTSIHQMLVKSEETALRYFGEGYGTSDLEFARAVIDKDVMPLVEGVIPGVFTVVSFIAAYIVLVGISQAMRYAMQEVSAPAPLFCDLKMPRVPAVFWLCALILVFVPNLNTRIISIIVIEERDIRLQ